MNSIDGSSNLSGAAIAMMPWGTRGGGCALQGAFESCEWPGIPPSQAQLQLPQLPLQTTASLCSWRPGADKSPSLPGTAAAVQVVAAQVAGVDWASLCSWGLGAGRSPTLLNTAAAAKP